MDKPLVFFHIGCVGLWKDVVPKMLKSLASSGLADHATFYVGILGSKQDQHLVKSLCKSVLPRLYVHTTEDESLYEHFTLEWLQTIVRPLTSRHPVLYMHTKAVTRNEANFHTWRDYMVHWTVTRWKDMVKVLTDNDALGVSVNYRGGPKPHFAGNLWWSTSDHLKSLPSTHEVEARLKPRFKYVAPEMWLLWNAPLDRVFSLHQPLHRIRCHGISDDYKDVAFNPKKVSSF